LLSVSKLLTNAKLHHRVDSQTVQTILAIAIPVAIVVVAWRLYSRDRREHPDPTLPDTATRRAQYLELLRDTPTTPFDGPNPGGEEPKAALLLLSEAKASFERATADRSSIESRAATLVGLAAGVTGASAFVSSGKGVAFTPAFAAAAILAVISVGCLLFILRYKFNPQPNPASLNLANTVWDEAMEFRICLSLAESYGQGLTALIRASRVDRIALFVAGLALVGAISLVIVNFAFPPSQPRADTTCSMRYAGSRIIGLECKE
jgi:hypothetical protein